LIKYRQYRSGDEKLIIKLYKKVFRKELTIQNWHWKYNTYASADKFIFLAFNESRCIGQYALIPYRLSSYGDTIQALLSLDSMIDPDYQGRRIFTELMNYARKELLNLKDPSITFINENTFNIYTKQFNWKYVGNIPVYCRPLSLMQLRNGNKILYIILKPFSLIINSISSEKNNISLDPINIFDLEIERKCINADKLYSIGRTKEFLNWRYIQSPEDYDCFKIMYKGNLIGYCVIKIEEKFGLKFAWIMDIFIEKKYANFFHNVLNAISIKYFLKSDFITSLLPNSYYKKYYLKSVFLKIPQVLFPHKFYFCTTINHSNQKDICNLEHWYMTWSLNDVI
tara:strand:- start:7104 stop:8123 length:1020 start_codon:yes stop_codon:yes gene_type:complete